MSSERAVHELMLQVGPVLDLEQVTEFAEDHAWRLVFDAATAIDIEYDSYADRLVLTADVAPVELHAREKTFEAMLRYNYLWTEHGGVRAALDGAPGRAVLMIEMPASGLEMTRICAVLKNFSAVVEGWRGVLASIATAGGASDAPFNATGMIRV
jgi:hypothetical protein